MDEVVACVKGESVIGEDAVAGVSTRALVVASSVVALADGAAAGTVVADVAGAAAGPWKDGSVVPVDGTVDAPVMDCDLTGEAMGWTNTAVAANVAAGLDEDVALPAKDGAVTDANNAVDADGDGGRTGE